MSALSLGFIEIPHLCDAIEALDIMLKRADVSFVTWEKKLGGRLVTVIISGTVAGVTEAVETAKAHVKGRIVASLVLANPHEEVWKMVRASQRRHQ